MLNIKISCVAVQYVIKLTNLYQYIVRKLLWRTSICKTLIIMLISVTLIPFIRGSNWGWGLNHFLTCKSGLSWTCICTKPHGITSGRHCICLGRGGIHGSWLRRLPKLWGDTLWHWGTCRPGWQKWRCAFSTLQRRVQII